MSEGELKAPRGTNTPYAELFVSHFGTTRGRPYLDFPDLDADTFRLLDAIRKQLDGEARAAMDKLLGPLEQQIKAEPWGKKIDGIQCRVVPDKAKWHQGEVPSFKAEVRNQGKRDLVIWQAQELCEIVLDGRTLRWSGPVEAKSSAFGPGRHYKGIAITLVEAWRDENGKPPSLTSGKHTIRVVFRPEPPNEEGKPPRVESNEVQIEIAAIGR